MLFSRYFAYAKFRENETLAKISGFTALEDFENASPLVLY